LSWLTGQVIAQIIPEIVQRNNPRVVKKPGAKFLSKQVKHRGTGIIMNAPVFIILSTA
jgi:flagellar motor component MotA